MFWDEQKPIAGRRLWPGVLLALALLAGPAFAANSIAVVSPGLGGTNHALQVTFDPAMNNQAVVISKEPTQEQIFRIEFSIATGNNLTLCKNPSGCRVFIGRAIGNRNSGSKFLAQFRLGLKQINNGAYFVFVWYRDLNSNNPGNWEGVPGNIWLPGNGGPSVIAVEWKAATDVNTSDGTIRTFEDGVLVGQVSGINNPFDVSNMRIGHVAGAVTSGASGTILLDEYASFRTLAP